MHVFQLVGSGLGTREIAQSLDLSVKTVETHREHIKHKLRLSSGAQLRERAAKWAKETSGVRRSPKLRIHAFGERKPFRPGESEELHRRHQQSTTGGASDPVSLQIPESASTVSVIPKA